MAKPGPRPRAMLIGHRAAIFGLLLCGVSTFTISNILGFPITRVRDEVPPDWMPPKHGHKRKEKRPRRKSIDQDALIADFKSGWHTLQEVANRHSCTREYVRQVVARAGISQRTHGGESPEVLNDRLQRYLKALQPGVTSAQAEGISGVTHKAAWQAAIALRLTPPKFVRAQRVRYQEIAAYYEANPHLTGLAVGKHFGVGPNTISKALRVMGVRARHTGWTHARAARWPTRQQEVPA
jgi:hypothetical protein